MNTQKVLTGVAVIVALVFAVLYFTKPVQVVQQSFAGTNQPVEQTYFQGGLNGKTTGFNNATTSVVCMIQNPTNATTTFRARFVVSTATTSVTVLSLATSTNANRFATTSNTAIMSKTVGASVQGVSSFVGTNDNNILGPREWVKWYFDNGTAISVTPNGGTGTQLGTCAVDFFNIF